MGVLHILVDPYRRTYFHLNKWFTLARVLRAYAAENGPSDNQTHAERCHIAGLVLAETRDAVELSPEAEVFVHKAAAFCQRSAWMIHEVSDTTDRYDAIVRGGEYAKDYGWPITEPFRDESDEDYR